MKFVKLSIFALTMGLFVASCGESKTEEAATTDSTTMEATPAVVDSVAAPVDSVAAPVDSVAAPATK